MGTENTPLIYSQFCVTDRVSYSKEINCKGSTTMNPVNGRKFCKSNMVCINNQMDFLAGIIMLSVICHSL
jgi:hypothetical protein